MTDTNAVRKMGTATQVAKLGASEGALAEKAMLVKLSIHQWYSQVTDKGATQLVHRTNNAVNAGEFRKWLLPKHIAKKQRALENKLRKIHNTFTLPWSDDGYRVLSGAGYQRYMDEIRKVKVEYLAFADEILVDYESLKAHAKAQLGQLWIPSEFPSVEVLRAKYGVDTHVQPIPAGSDFRVDVGNEAAARIKGEIEAMSKDKLDAAMKDIWARLIEVVSAMSTRLKVYTESDGENTFRDSLLGNITGLLDIVPMLNIYDDPDLAAMSARIRAELTKHTATVLRDDAKIRKQTAVAADAILKQIGDFLA
jgi:hypothetical protein